MNYNIYYRLKQAFLMPLLMLVLCCGQISVHAQTTSPAQGAAQLGLSGAGLLYSDAQLAQNLPALMPRLCDTSKYALNGYVQRNYNIAQLSSGSIAGCFRINKVSALGIVLSHEPSGAYFSRDAMGISYGIRLGAKLYGGALISTARQYIRGYNSNIQPCGSVSVAYIYSPQWTFASALTIPLEVSSYNPENYLRPRDNTRFRLEAAHGFSSAATAYLSLERCFRSTNLAGYGRISLGINYSASTRISFQAGLSTLPSVTADFDQLEYSIGMRIRSGKGLSVQISLAEHPWLGTTSAAGIGYIR